MVGNHFTIAVLALQGNFLQHVDALTRSADALELKLNIVLIKKLSDLASADLDALVIGGGESSTLGHLLHTSDLYEAIQQLLNNRQFPLLTTCAGTILVSKNILNKGITAYPNFIREDFDVQRNAFGRQVDSFYAELPFKPKDAQLKPKATNGFLFSKTIKGYFIRAPKFLHVPEHYHIVARYKDEPAIIQRQSSLFSLFHPEAAGDLSLHSYFLLQISKFS